MTGIRSGKASNERWSRVMQRLLLIVMIVALFTALAIVSIEVYDSWQAQALSYNLKNLYGSRASVPNWLSILGNVAYADEAKTEESLEGEPVIGEIPDIQEDFLRLYEQNSDVVGWLTAGDGIDYPVVQRDNTYYLDHSFYGKSDVNGTIFVNACNTFWPRDDVILIHGHNMKNGAMFGTLQRLQNYEYLRKHPIVAFRTIWDEQDVYYVPFAAFNASMTPGEAGYFDITRITFEDDSEQTPAPDEFKIAGTTFPTSDSCSTLPSETLQKNTEYQAYLDELLQWSEWKSPVDVSISDPLLMLVTCSYEHENGRLVVVCRRFRENETPESMKTLFNEPVPKEGL